MCRHVWCVFGYLGDRMLGYHSVGGAESVGAVAQAKPQHDLVRDGEVEKHNVAPEEDVADEELGHAAAALDAGRIQLREIPHVEWYAQ